MSSDLNSTGSNSAPQRSRIFKRVLVAGSSGLIGRALCDALALRGDQVTRLVRQHANAAEWVPDSDNGQEIFWDPTDTSFNQLDAVEGFDAVVHLGGQGIGDKRWSEETKRKILNSRVDSTTVLANAIANSANKPSAFLCASAIGFYGSAGDALCDETAPAGSGFLSEVTQAWEQATTAASQAGVTTVLLRTGMVLDKNGGALAKMLLPFKLGLGGRIGSGDQWQSWISLTDHIRALVFLIDKACEGSLQSSENADSSQQQAEQSPLSPTSPIAVNLVAPNPVTQREFSKALSKQLNRPNLIPMPGFALKLLLGKELAQELVLSSTRVEPKMLQNLGFRFENETIESAFTEILG